MIRLPARAIRMTPEHEHWFFGYYDLPAFDRSGRRHLAMQVPFMDRLPQPDDRAMLHVLDLDSGRRDCFAETTAWNFQQGCMLQWHPTRPDTVLYNIRTEDTDCGYGAVVHSLAGGGKRFLDRPVAHVAADGRSAVSINFDRLFDFRPGYGYAGQTDRWQSVNHPDDDGVYLVDLETGRSRLLVSLQQIWDFAGGFFGGADQKIGINHITFSKDGSRILMLARNFPTRSTRWSTALITCDAAGNDWYLLSDFAMASHYHWRDGRVMAIYSDGRELGDQGPQLYELTDKTHAGRVIDAGFFTADGHNSYSPDLNWMLYDSYPLADNQRELYVYNLNHKTGGLLGRFAVTPGCAGDIRCDLHPRWSPDGRAISFDSVHEGYRGLYWMDLSEARQYLGQATMP